jgi:hypothetical protein
MQLDRIPGMALEFRKAVSRQLPVGVSEAYRDLRWQPPQWHRVKRLNR